MARDPARDLREAARLHVVAVRRDQPLHDLALVRGELGERCLAAAPLLALHRAQVCAGAPPAALYACYGVV